MPTIQTSQPAQLGYTPLPCFSIVLTILITPAYVSNHSDWRFCVAPMIAVTDRHCRYFLRLISKRARLYTEMITCAAIIHGDRDYLLGFSEQEHPVALQLGGHKPEEFAHCASIAQAYGYDEININVGCPSDRVQSGRFGACLMKEPQQVAACYSALTENCSLPVTIKCRIGVDEFDSYEFLENFVANLASAGCKTFIVHARIALLKGLSPKENRSIPPLHYHRVEKVKQTFPDLTIVLNGGIQSLNHSKNFLNTFDGVMLGREIYKDPYLMIEVDKQLFNDTNTQISRSEIVEQFLPYIARHMEQGFNAHNISRHMVGLFHGQSLARKWRAYISSNPVKQSSDLNAMLKLAQEIEAFNSSTQEHYQYA